MQNKMMQFQQRPNHYLFNETRYQPTPVASGLSQSTTILNGITGCVSWLIFTVRYTNAMSGTGNFNFLPISSFTLLGSDGSNICGGSAISSATCLLMMNRWHTLGSYSAENSLGVVNNGSNAYMFSFSCDPITQSSNGTQYGCKNFLGNEQLIITFASALTSTAQIDIYASVNGIIEQTTQYIKKKSL